MSHLSRAFAVGVALCVAAALWLPALPAAAQTGGFRPGPQYQGFGFGKNKVQYRDFDWQIYHSPHFDVYYYSSEEDQLERVVSFAESAYDRLSRQFDFQIQEPTPLIFYATHSAFEQNNIILNFIPEGTGAFATPVRFRMVMPVDLPDPELMDLMLHELTHIFQYHILFQGSITRVVSNRAPLWLMEGMASFMAQDESARDRMFLRDAVVNDRIPEMTRWNGGGFFAYRMGHALFEFMVERWGYEGYLDFIYEFRNTLSGSIGRAVERTFRMEPDEFDQEFRLWLRRRYLAQLLETGEPGEFGRPFRNQQGQGAEISAVSSPSGDLVAAFSVIGNDVDVVLFDAVNRRYLRSLTEGFTNEYRYLVAQELTLGRKMGRDLAFSPDGNTVAVFGKREDGRSLFLIDVLNGKLRDRIDFPGLDQQVAPAFSPDGRSVAFSGWSESGFFDIFIVDLETEELTNVTQDEIFDGAPVFSPDGESLVFTSVVGDEGYGKLFRLDLGDPGRNRVQLTFGESNDTDAVFSTVADRVYFTSDRSDDGVENIFGLDLDTGLVNQYTNAVTGCFMPTILPRAEDGGERLVFSSLWKGTFQLYVSDIEEPVGEPVESQLAEGEEEVGVEEIPQFEPDIQVAINEDNKEQYGGFKLFIEGADTILGVDDDQTFVGRAIISWSDYLGDKRLIGSFASVDSFSNFDIIYTDLSDRLQWQVHLFDDRVFFLGQDELGFLDREQQIFSQTGALASLIYPFSFYSRAEIGLGYMFRELDNPFNPLVNFDEDFPFVQGALVRDTSVFAPWGAVSGSRVRLDGFYAPDPDGSGLLTASVDLDARKYVPLTRRSNFAFRAFLGGSDTDTVGNIPSPIIFGGLDDVRGVPFQAFAGDRAFFANAELRFPLIDILATPAIAFQGIRGVFFFDVGGAWFDEFQEFDVWNSQEDRFEDAIAVAGFGVTIRLFGLNLNWDFAQLVEANPLFEEALGDGFNTTFWIGTRF